MGDFSLLQIQLSWVFIRVTNRRRNASSWKKRLDVIPRTSPHLPESCRSIQPSAGVGTFRLDIVQGQWLPRLLRAGPSASLDEYSGLLNVDKFCQFTMRGKRMSIGGLR
jgi:hypothetical protein